MQLTLRVLPLLALAVLLAVMAVAAVRPAQAQASTLALSDFDQTGLDVELLAVITAGEDELWYARDRFGDVGTLVDGELGIGPGNNGLIRIRSNAAGSSCCLTTTRAASSPSGHTSGPTAGSTARAET